MNDPHSIHQRFQTCNQKNSFDRAEQKFKYLYNFENIIVTKIWFSIPFYCIRVLLLINRCKKLMQSCDQSQLVFWVSCELGCSPNGATFTISCLVHWNNWELLKWRKKCDLIKKLRLIYHSKREKKNFVCPDFVYNILMPVSQTLRPKNSTHWIMELNKVY